MSRTRKSPAGYDADSLVVLEGLDAVRKRPGMYIGDTGPRGLHHLLAEIVDNAVDEVAAGHGDTISIELNADGSATVTDNGRGIPVDVEPSTGLTGVEVVFTKLHAGGKFGTGGYATAGGLHGVGASVTNALASELHVEVWRDGRTHEMGFRGGVPGRLDARGAWRKGGGLKLGAKAPKKKTGTRVRFLPDPGIFGDATFEFEPVCERLAQVAFLLPGLTIEVTDHRSGDTRTFASRSGLADFVDHLGGGDPVCDTLVINGEGTFAETVPVLVDGKMTPTEVERTCAVHVALRWVAGWDTRIVGYVNTVPTPSGGTHVSGFSRALTTVVNEALRDSKVLKVKEPNPSGDDVQEGLVAVVRVVLPEPQFEGQTKSALGTPAVQSIVYRVVADGLRGWAGGGGKKRQVRAVLDKVANASRARTAARLQRDTVRRKSALENSSLPSKLADCRSNDSAVTELLLVEGDSAAGPCFTGDTFVLNVDGVSRSFRRLAADWERGVVHHGYALSPTGEIVVVPLMHPRLTRRNAKLVSVTLSNEEAVRCTPDHLFRLADGSYRPAAELTAADTLASWADTLGVGEPVRPVGVTSLADREDVYDLSVLGYENFALDVEVFVHNCKAGRDSATQAVLPLRGKILNAMKASAADVLRNAECQGIFAALGAGFGKTFGLEQCRYGRVILLCDADVDGSHIRCLLLTLFHTYCRPLLEAGRVYAAMPPLYAIKVGGKGEMLFAYSDEERDRLLVDLEKKGTSVRAITRFKGLGEMSVDELASTTLDPSRRTLRQITVEDAEAATEAFRLCMGEDVEPRRRFIIEESARYHVDDLDV